MPGRPHTQRAQGTPAPLFSLQGMAANPPGSSLGKKKKKRGGEKEETEIAGRSRRALGGGLAKRLYSGEKGLFSQAFLRQLFSAPKQRQRGLSGGPPAGSRARTSEQDQIP